MKQDRAGRQLFVVAIFASAFLIFLVQPMVGKRILPWFGGSPAVWTLCLAFYQTTLFVGYAYAHLLVRYANPSVQLAIHALAVTAAFIALPVLPGDAWKPDASTEPTAFILTMLASNVALPFLVLAATGPLVQVWFARRYPDRSPYPLYAVSNVGSLLALISYPFLIEPRLPLSSTGDVWSFAFAATGVVVLACAGLARRPSVGLRARGSSAAAPAEAPPSPARIALWFLLPACAVIVLMGVTNSLCLDMASVPFLWILPLAAYLGTFILCFGSERAYRRVPYVAIVALGVAWPIYGPWLKPYLGTVLPSAHGQIVLHCLVLFATCMVMHGELYRLRPAPRSLTLFYLCVTAGGAVGGLFVGVAAPRVFDGYYELQAGLGLAWLLLLLARWSDSSGWLHSRVPGWRWALVVSLSSILLASSGYRMLPKNENLVHEERTFFGVLRVLESEKLENRPRRLLNGRTVHGVQLRRTAALRRRPTSYFGVATGIGIALNQGAGDDAPRSIGVIGLGTGTLAAYGRQGDRFRFYEIDPAVIRLAGEGGYFSFLSDSRAEIEVVAGDARLSLATELEKGIDHAFDMLIIDAFSSDAIPVHLLTREAFEIYAASTRVDGLVAIHVSNLHFDFAPLVARLGASAGMQSLYIVSATIPEASSQATKWVFLSRDPTRIDSLDDFAGRWRFRPLRVQRFEPALLRSTPLWTDDYSDLFGVLRPLQWKRSAN